MKAIFVLVTERKRKQTSSWKGDAHHTAGASKTENSLSRFLPGSTPCNWHLFSIFLTVIFPPTVSCLPQVCSFSCSLLNLGQAIQEQYRKNIKQRKHNIRNIRNWILKTKYSKNKFVTTITVITVTPITVSEQKIKISWAQITQFLFGFVVCVVLESFGLIGILFFHQVSWPLIHGNVHKQNVFQVSIAKLCIWCICPNSIISLLINRLKTEPVQICS